jgi:hypothetical protein
LGGTEGSGVSLICERLARPNPNACKVIISIKMREKSIAVVKIFFVN